MSFKEISQSGVLYVCVAVGLLTVVAISVLYLRKSYNHAIACGVSKEKMKGIIKSSISFSIVPSIARRADFPGSGHRTALFLVQTFRAGFGNL